MVVCREGTEGPYAGAGGAMRVGTPQEVATEESINTGFGVERIVRDAFERATPPPRQGDARAQDQRARPRRQPVAAHLRRRGRGVSRTSRPTTATSTRRHVLPHAARAVRRRRHRQPVRRHHHRHRCGDRRRHRPGGQRQPRPEPRRTRACSSPCTVRRPTSPARARPTRRPRCSRVAMLLDHLGETGRLPMVEAAVAADLVTRHDRAQTSRSATRWRGRARRQIQPLRDDLDGEASR